MKIAFFSNFISHHQVHVADELYRLTDCNYTFVELEAMPDSFVKTGYPDYSSRPYVLQAWKSEDKYKQAMDLAIECDVMIIGSLIALPFEVRRCRNTDKLTFEYRERWLKKGLKNLLSPRLQRWLWYYHTLFKSKPVYTLCASAFASSDLYRLGAMKNRCYRWGYFTEVTPLDIEKRLSFRDKETLKMMWCARMIEWKHPELVVQLSERLKNKGYKIEVNMYGDGVLKDEIDTLINQKGLRDVVSLKGNIPNEEVLQAMKDHDIFLFTSDHQEGWGAVANEAMASGCVLVGSDKIGSVPFLVKDNSNGLIFKSCDLDDLTNKVESLLLNRQLMNCLAKKGYETMINIWSPQNAARQFLQLVECLNNGSNSSLLGGPCSKI